MIRIEQQRDLGHQIMTVRGEQQDGRDVRDFREQMLLHNHIDGVMPFEIRTGSGEKVYEYDIENLVSLSEYCSGKKPGKKTLDRVLKGVLSIVLRGREFMLAEDDYIVSPENIYIDKDEKVYLAYYPGYGENLRLQLKDLSEYLMNEVDYTDEEAVLTVYGFYMRTKEKGTTFEDLMGLLTGIDEHREAVYPVQEGMSGEYSADEQPAGGHQSYVAQDLVEIVPDKVPSHRSDQEKLPSGRADQEKLFSLRNDPEKTTFRRNDTEIKGEESDASKENIPFGKVFSESSLRLKLVSIMIPVLAAIVYMVLSRQGLFYGKGGHISTVKTFLAVMVLASGCFEIEKMLWTRFAKEIREKFRSAREKADEETVLLYGGENMGYAFSLVSDIDPPINVSHFPFFVGKDASRCDYVMATQVGISRFHMKIDRDGEDYTISDLNSTNGTFINGERLAPHYPQKVRRGDELRIGKCIYYCN